MSKSEETKKNKFNCLWALVAVAGGLGIVVGLYYGFAGGSTRRSANDQVLSVSPAPTQSSQPSQLPSAIPSSLPSLLPSIYPSGSVGPSELPSILPSAFPSTSFPTSSPSQSPTTAKVPVNPEPDSPPRGYFNYDPDSQYGPNRWNRVDTSQSWLREFGPNGFGPWKGHFSDDLTQNLCGGPARKESPKDLTETLRCEAHHEIRTKCASNPLTDNVAFESQILPHKLSIVAERRPCLDVDEAGDGIGSCEGRRPPIVDYPRYASAISDYSDLQNYDVKVPGEHTIEGERFDAEVQMFHTHLGNERLSSIGVLIRAKENGFNGEFQKILDKFQIHYNQDKALCNANRRLRAQGLNSTQFQRRTQNTVKFNPYAEELMPNMSFYRYDGSITEPPCKDITWWVMDTPMQISFDQLEQLKQILLTHVDPNCQKTSVHNADESVARPIQPLGEGRDIQYCRTGDFKSDESKGRGQEGFVDEDSSYELVHFTHFIILRINQTIN